MGRVLDGPMWVRIIHRGSWLARASITTGLAMTMLVVGCGSGGGSSGEADGESRTVMATTPIWADVVGSVMCNRVPVESIAPQGSDSHDFELSMRSADRVLGAELIFANGLELETDLSSVFDRAVESGTDVVYLGDRLPTDLPPIDGDPHIWTDPGNIRALIPTIEEELAPLDLMDPDELHGCAEEYSTALGGLIEDMDKTLSTVPAGGRKLVGEHRNLGYFARRFDFEVLGSMVDSSSSLAEADTKNLDSLRTLMRREGIATVFIDVADSDAAASAFVRDVSPDGEVVGLYLETMPSADDAVGGDTGSDTGDHRYLEMMQVNAQRVATALGE